MNLQGLLDFLHSDEGSRSLMGFGQSMAAAGQPSRIPVSTGAALSQGLAGGLGSYDEAMKLKRQQLMDERQKLIDAANIRALTAQAGNAEADASGKIQEQGLIRSLVGGAGATEPTGLMGAVNAGVTGPDVSGPAAVLPPSMPPDPNSAVRPGEMPAPTNGQMSPADALLMIKSPPSYAARMDERKKKQEADEIKQSFIKTIPPGHPEYDRLVALANAGQYDAILKILHPVDQENALADNSRLDKTMIFNQEDQLRGRYETALNTYTQTSTGYRKMQEAYATNRSKPEGEADPTADMSLIFGYMKMLDPTSTVREGEYATAAQAGGIPAKVWNLYNNAVGGGKLTNAVRKQFYEQAQKIYKREYKSALATRDRYRSTAQQYPGLNPARAISDPSSVDDLAPEAGDPSMQVDHTVNPKFLKEGNWLVNPDGSKEFWIANRWVKQ